MGVTTMIGNPYACGASLPAVSPQQAQRFEHGTITVADHLPGNKLVNPPGWQPCWMWDRKVTAFWCSRLGQRVELPNLYYVELYWEYLQHQDARVTQPTWVHASQVPAELRRNILDYYGDDLTEFQEVLCAEQLARRDRAASRCPGSYTIRKRRAIRIQRRAG